MIKTERKQIHFLSDVLVAVTSLDLRVSIIRLNSRAGKMEQIPRSDLLPERARWPISGFPALVPQEKVLLLAI